MPLLEDKKVLVGTIGASIITYNVLLRLYRYYQSQKNVFIPIGTVKELYIYPIKSCKGKKVFSFYCGPQGPICGEIKDRFFQVINGDTGRFYTARQKPTMILIESEIENNHLTVTFPAGNKVVINIDEVKARRDVRQTKLHAGLRQDGYDCGDEISVALSEYMEEPNTRLVMYSDELFTERICRTEPEWWKNNPVPKRNDKVGYSDLAPYMIQTEGSLIDLNSRLDDDVTQLHFRPVIVVDHCPAWDEDKWIDLKFGETQLECFKPCTRCILTTVDPKTGIKNPDMQPLKKLKEFRMAPDGVMRDSLKDSPIFGVNAGLTTPGYVHVGQVVYARYKPSIF